MKISSFFYYIISVIVYWARKVFYLIESLLFLRLVLKFAGANPSAAIADAIYTLSNIFTSPFDGIFQNIFWRENLIEISTLTAMVGYLILGFMLLKLIQPFQRRV